jgi:signal transduction histidine kinase
MSDDQATYSLHELLGMVMHELRAPLSTLSMSVDLLVNDTEQLGPRETQKLLRRIQRSTSWLQALVDNLTIAAQAEVSQLQLRHRAVELRDALDMALTIVQPSLDREGQRVVSEGIDGVRARGDTRQIEQILVNLLLNASKYGRPDTAIDVSARLDGKFVRVEVRDAGPGIPEDEHERIFRRYVRGTAALERGNGGLGLGLHIVKILAELHGGQVGVCSTPGNGATFWFTLPAAVDPGLNGGKPLFERNGE